MHSTSFSSFDSKRRFGAVITAAMLLHAGGLWALQAGLLRPAPEVLTPAEVLIDVSPPQDEPAPPKPTMPPLPVAQPTPAPRALAPRETPRPAPLAVPAPASEPVPADVTPAPVLPAAGPNTASALASATPATPITSPNAPRPQALELPNSDADYLNNPRPAYPPLSKRLGEQGKVVIRTLIGTDGMAQQAEIKQSSGFDRLDQAALATALKWRYTPGKRAGVTEAMWFDVPFNWVLR